jgi:hypothetical protein
MKKFMFAFIYLFPNLIFAQKIVVLTINQPPEFVFSVSKTDTTIIKGRSVVLETDLIVFGGSGEYKYNWSPAATLNDSTIIHPLATPSDTTIYKLTITDKYGCSFSVNYTVNTRNPLVGIESIPYQQNLQAILFPNPNNGKFKVSLTGVSSEKIELLIFDSTGKVVKKQTVRNFTGDHTEMIQLKLLSGIYTLHIDSGIETLSRQFIIN